MILESKNFLFDQEIVEINNYILGNNFPWYFQESATSNKFHFFSHGLIQRYNHTKEEPQSNSDVTPHIMKMFERFADEHKLKVNKITRGCLNLTHHHGKFIHGDPHVDHEFDHKVFMIYLNNTSGDTIIFDKKYNGKKTVLDVNKKLKIKERIKPELGKAICFDGSYYHTAAFCKPMQRRVVAVLTFV